MLDGVPAGAEAGIWEKLYPEYKDIIHYDELTDIGKAYVEKFNGFGVPNMAALFRWTDDCL
jgi:hypothetical protein